MTRTLLPATHAILEVFAEEVSLAGGTLAQPFDDGERLFLRSVLPAVGEARRDDRLQAGVALRSHDDEILIHPYVFRQVCRNGAIMPQVIETRRIVRVDEDAWDSAVADVLSEVREVVRACASADVFATAVAQIRSAADVEADQAVMLGHLIERLPSRVAAEMLSSILGRFHQGKDRSAFGLMNAVTSLARDTRDPDLRWRLEELGGGVAARLPRVPSVDSARMLAAV